MASVCTNSVGGHEYGTWKDKVDGILARHTGIDFRLYTTSVLAVTTMTTIGYGDITPANEYERLFAMFVMVTGTAVYSYGITSVIQLTPVLVRNRYDHKQKDILS